VASIVLVHSAALKDFGLVTMLAWYVLARRVLGIDPAQLLRQE
jgi:hypothetical protein